jgi:purine nucleosidase
VFESGIPLTLLPLDVTHKALTTRARLQRFQAMATRTGQAVAELLNFFERYDVHKYGFDGGPLHDPCVIAWLLRPDLFGGKEVNVSVECESELTMGATVVDWWRVTKRPPNATYIRDIDADGFFALLAERIARLP